MAAADPPIEPMEWPESNDADSGYDEEQISTASVTSSILAYQEENGRTYHAYRAGKYVMPNDEGEQERMDRKPVNLSSHFSSNLIVFQFTITPLE
jgi:hypothetical protein